MSLRLVGRHGLELTLVGEDSVSVGITLPIGLAFALLKGSLAHVDEVLCECRSPEEVRRARMELATALEAFQSSVAECREGFLKEHIARLGRDLIRCSHTMFETAASQLSSAVKLL